MDEGDECCEPKPINDTCSNQRVHCGYGYFKNDDYEGKGCTNCYDNGDECCTRKTCGARGVGDAVSCTKGFFTHVNTDTECYNCVNNGAECCVRNCLLSYTRALLFLKMYLQIFVAHLQMHIFFINGKDPKI